LDQILEDLRKYGFTIITGLLTAGAFLGKPGTTDSNAEVFIAVMVLVTALFSIDIYYQVLLSGAVERALDLEAQTKPPIWVTKHISENAKKCGIHFIIVVLYLALLGTAGGIGFFAANAPQHFIVILGLLLAVYILLYWGYCTYRFHLYRQKKERTWQHREV
jgi:hypothetical protein